MAPLSRRGDSALRPLVFALSDLLPPHVGNDDGARFGDRSELYLAIGSAVWAGTGKALPHLKPTNKSYRVDETYIKVKGKDRYLYRAVDSTGQTIDFLLTAKRDTVAAKRFFRKALAGPNNPQPRVINVDKNPAYVPAVTELKSEGVLRRRCRLRQCKYLNNMVEQDHRTVKKRVWLAKGYGSFHSAWRTIRGVEAVHLIRKGRVRRVAKHDSLAQARFISTLFGVAI